MEAITIEQRLRRLELLVQQIANGAEADSDALESLRKDIARYEQEEDIVNNMNELFPRRSVNDR